MLRSPLQALLGIVMVSALFVPGHATICVKEDQCFTSETELTAFFGSPTVLCITGYNVVRIQSFADCHGHEAGPAVVLRCGATSQSFSYSGPHNSTHTLETLSNWQNVMEGACEDLVYTVD